jgi:hypothetical protein
MKLGQKVCMGKPYRNAHGLPKIGTLRYPVRFFSALVRDREIGGSNPPAPTAIQERPFPGVFSLSVVLPRRGWQTPPPRQQFKKDPSRGSFSFIGGSPQKGMAKSPAPTAIQERPFPGVFFNLIIQRFE